MSELFSYFQYPFVRYALIVGVLVSLCSALFGVVLVLKRFSFIGDGLSHVAFGALAVSAVVGLTNDVLIVMPITVLAAILILKSGQHTKIKGDAMIAMVSVGALAVGYLLLDRFSTSANVAGDVCGSLFGSFSILTLTEVDLWISLVMSALVVGLFIFCYHRIFSVTFDEDFARAVGIRVSLYNLLIATVTAVIIVLAMNLVGSLLVSALIIFPALSAMRLSSSFRGVVILSVILSVLCSASGILLSLGLDTPVGPTIVAADLLAFFVCAVIGRVKR
ncbi:MAG: metal ABC transporter permease [Clostridia bacterium]|nr:metal ABC transporter permease [Clostridia bacterium]